MGWGIKGVENRELSYILFLKPEVSENTIYRAIYIVPSLSVQTASFFLILFKRKLICDMNSE